MPAKKQRSSLQKNVTIPPSDWPRIEAAMAYDGVRSFSQFALAAINQRVRRIEQQRAVEEKSRDQK